MVHLKKSIRVYDEGDLNCKGNYKDGDKPVRIIYFEKTKQAP